MKVQLNGKWGWINEKGNEIIPCKYDDVDFYLFYHYGKAKIKLNGEVGVIDKNGVEHWRKDKKRIGKYKY
jgi:hypothetical protein